MQAQFFLICAKNIPARITLCQYGTTLYEKETLSNHGDHFPLHYFFPRLHMKKFSFIKYHYKLLYFINSY